MKESDRKVMALCDTEEEYARLMTEFLRRHKDLPWELHTYTRVEELLEREKHCPVAMLVVAESAYTEELQKQAALDQPARVASGRVSRWPATG